MKNLRYILLASAIIAAISCVKEAGDKSAARNATVFSIAIEDGSEIVPTKSVLTSDDIETKVTSITIAVYDADSENLITKAHFNNPASQPLSLELNPGVPVLVLALANMGDMTSAFTGSLDKSAITYTIPSYTGTGGLSARGLPMAGELELTPDGDDTAYIPLTRLAARVTAFISLDWPGTIDAVRIRGINRKLKPFAVSAAASSADILDGEEVEFDVPASSVSFGTFTFYVPENRQGTVDGIDSPADKTRDNAALSSICDRLTYLEVVASGTGIEMYYDYYYTGGADGTITYRSYLGKNDVTDFDIVRNCRYIWNVTYGYNGLENDDWKHENSLSWVKLIPGITFPKDVLYLNETAEGAVRWDSEYWVRDQKSETQANLPDTGADVSLVLSYSGFSAPYTPDDGTLEISVASDMKHFTYTGAAPGKVNLVAATKSSISGATEYESSSPVSVLPYSRTGKICFNNVYATSSEIYTKQTIPASTGVEYDFSFICDKAGYNSSPESAIVRKNVDYCYSGSISVHNASYNSYLGYMRSGSVIYNKALSSANEPLSTSYTFSQAGTYIVSGLVVYQDPDPYTNGKMISKSILSSIAVDVVQSTSYWLTVTPTAFDWKTGESKSLNDLVTALKIGSDASSSAISASRLSYALAPGSSSDVVSVTSAGAVTCLKAGTASIRVTASGDASLVPNYADISITVTDVVTHSLVVTGPAAAELTGGSATAQLRAYFKTFTNGAETASDDVTAAATWSKTSGPSGITVSSAGLVTATVKGTGTFRASYNGQTSSVHSVTFTEADPPVQDVTTWRLEVSPATRSILKGSTISTSGDFTVRARKYVNSVSQAETKTPTGVSWAITSNPGTAISLSGTTITGVNAGTATLTVSSSDSTLETGYRSAVVTVIVTASSTVDDGWESGGDIDL